MGKVNWLPVSELSKLTRRMVALNSRYRENLRDVILLALPASPVKITCQVVLSIILLFSYVLQMFPGIYFNHTSLSSPVLEIDCWLMLSQLSAPNG